MATARPVGTVRRAGSATGGPGTASPEIPPARWAGVALVIAALIGTIALGVLSPGDSLSPELAAGAPTETQAPQATIVPGGDIRVPSARPVITAPRTDSVGSEWDIGVTVDVPQEKLPSRFLDLVIFRDGQEVKRQSRPARGKPVTVRGGVRLNPGRNELTAALAGPGGFGPVSEKVIVHLDSDAPVLEITAPENGTETLESSLDVAISSDPGAALVVHNQATDREVRETVGPSGAVSVSVRLDPGRNRIDVTSTDDAGMRQDKSVVVVRKDGSPKIELTVPKQVRRADLPRRLRIAVLVTDADGNEIPDATVNFSLSGLGWDTQSNPDRTDASGRAEWRPVLPASGSSDPVRIAVEVVVNGFSDDDFKEIRIS
jgi:glucodextranase-like protein